MNVLCVTKPIDMNIDTAIEQLTEIKESIADLNDFAKMQTTQEDRKMILLEWARLSQQRKAIRNEFNQG